MSWAIGHDGAWNRDVGYGVPAVCDYPGCFKEIDRGLSHICGDEMYGGDNGCGLFFCPEHLLFDQLCERCATKHPAPFEKKPDHPRWLLWKMLEDTWEEWRNTEEGKLELEKYKIQLLQWAEYGSEDYFNGTC